MRMRRPRSLAVLLLSLSLANTQAFVPDRFGRTTSSQGRKQTFVLHYTPVLPAAPPPPPPPPEGVDSNILEQVVKDASRFFENLGMPKLENLELGAFEEQIKATSLNLENLQLPKLELAALKEQVETLDADILAKFDGIARSLEAGLLSDYPTIQPLYEKVTALAAPLIAQPSLSIAVSAVVSYLLVSQILSFGKPAPPSQPYPMGKYDPISARAYFDERPLQVVTRGLQIAFLSLQFGLSLLKDQTEYVYVECHYCFALYTRFK
jgi:hypothetical protein